MLHSRLLEYLDEVARCQSMRAAGERLHVAGSAINRQILALENSLGVKLFERRPHSVVLTTSGELLIDHVRETLRGMQRTVQQIDDLKGLQWGEVSIGIASGLAGTLIPEVILRARHVFGRIKMRITVMPARDIVEAIAAGNLDLGFGFNLPTSDVRVLARRSAPVGAVMAARHPLAARAAVSIEECAAYPLCVASEPLTLRLRLERAFTGADVALRPVVETDSVELMRCMALDEPFVTFLSLYDTYRERRAGQLVHVPVAALLKDPETLVLVSPRADASALVTRIGALFKAALIEAA